jgi:hypothetical protein
MSLNRFAGQAEATMREKQGIYVRRRTGERFGWEVVVVTGFIMSYISWAIPRESERKVVSAQGQCGNRHSIVVSSLRRNRIRLLSIIGGTLDVRLVSGLDYITVMTMWKIYILLYRIVVSSDGENSQSLGCIGVSNVRSLHGGWPRVTQRHHTVFTSCHLLRAGGRTTTSLSDLRNRVIGTFQLQSQAWVSDRVYGWWRGGINGRTPTRSTESRSFRHDSDSDLS